VRALLLALAIAVTLSAQEYVLAVQWFPSVCKVKNYRACKKSVPFWRKNFTLHGLWPKDKTYCNVAQRERILDKRGLWNRLKLKLPADLNELIAIYMPGYLSALHKHEWVKHGTCYSESPHEYFIDSIYLVSQLNGSKVRDFFYENRGKRVSTAKISAIFDKEFSKGAGDRVKYICKEGYITELRVNLAGEITPLSDIASLIKEAKRTKRGCKFGKIAR